MTDDAPHHALEHELTVLARRWRGAAARLSREVHPDLDTAGYGLLVMLEETGPVRAGELVDALAVDKSTVSRQLANLESLGLVAREPDPADGRAHRVVTTEEGRSRLGALRERRLARWRVDLIQWPEDDVATLARLLGRLNAEGARSAAEAARAQAAGADPADTADTR